MANICQSKILKRYYRKFNNIITEIGSRQFPQNDGIIYGFVNEDGNYRQADDDKLSGCFPYILLQGKAEDDDENRKVYLYLDRYVQEGDKAISTSDPQLPKLQCTPDLHDDDCNTFAERHKKEWEEETLNMLLNGVNIDTVKEIVPKYFQKKTFSAEDGYKATAVVKVIYKPYLLLMWAKIDGEGKYTGNYLTDEEYFSLPQAQKTSYVARQRIETSEEEELKLPLDLPQFLMPDGYEELSADDKAFYKQSEDDYVRYDNLPINVLNTSNGGEATVNLVFFDDGYVDRVYMPIVTDNAKESADFILAKGNLAVNTITIGTEPIDSDSTETDDDNEYVNTIPYFAPSSSLSRRYYYVTSNVITSITNKQDKDGCGIMYGFDSQGEQVPNPEAIFPYIHFERTGHKYDEDGNLTTEDRDYSYYQFVDRYVNEGDTATGTATAGQMTCNKDNPLYNGETTFAQRFIDAAEQKIRLELLKGASVDYLKTRYPRYFTDNVWTESITESVKITHYKLKDGASGNYPETLTVTEYQSRTQFDKGCYNQETWYKLKSGKTSEYGSPITEEVYNTLPSEEKVKYEKYYQYKRKPELTKSSYKNELTYAEHATYCTETELDMLYIHYIYYMSKTQQLNVKVSVKDPNGQTPSNGFPLFTNERIEAILTPSAKKAAAKTANRMLKTVNLKVNSIELTTKPLN